MSRQLGTPFNLNAVGTNAGATATQAANGTKTHFLTNLQASGDAAALVTVESPSGTVLYKKRFAAAFSVSEAFTSPLKGANGQALLVKVSASTTNSEVDGQGYTV